MLGRLGVTPAFSPWDMFSLQWVDQEAAPQYVKEHLDTFLKWIWHFLEEMLPRRFFPWNDFFQFLLYSQAVNGD